MPTTPLPASERRAAADGRCTPRHSRGTLKDTVANRSLAVFAAPYGMAGSKPVFVEQTDQNGSVPSLRIAR
jgi:hypothetical protein